jgi:CO dehydrogenase/acetyl-CoA synthase beta subunit
MIVEIRNGRAIDTELDGKTIHEVRELVSERHGSMEFLAVYRHTCVDSPHESCTACETAGSDGVYKMRVGLY